MTVYRLERNAFFTLTPYQPKESILSITSWDYSEVLLNTSDLIGKMKENATVVLTSGCLELPEFTEFLANHPEIQTLGNLRVQISMGAELEKYTARIADLRMQGVSVDLLMDRPGQASLWEEYGEAFQHLGVRICVLGNRFFGLSSILSSVPPQLKTLTRMIFLPSTQEQSSYLSADEVVSALRNAPDAEDVVVLVFANAIMASAKVKNKTFFTEFNIENYYSAKESSGAIISVRKFLSWAVRRKWISALDVSYMILLFFKNPSWRSLKNILFGVSLIVRVGVKTSLEKCWFRIVGRSGQFWRFLQYPVWYSVKYKIWHPIWSFVRHEVWSFFRWEVFGFFRYRVPHLFWSTWNSPVIKVIFFPVRKAYWFFTYQFQTRILPLFKKEGTKE